jgi:colanic acid biosynthesis glycosyl transferase WcaI
MRITLVHQFYVPDISAVAHLAASFAEDRAGRGDEVTVVTSRGGYVPESEVLSHWTAENPRVIRLWTPRFGKATIVQRLVDYLFFYLLAAFRVLTLPRQDVMVLLTTPPFIGWTGVLYRLFHPRTRLLLWNMDCYPEVAERSGVLKPQSWSVNILRTISRRLLGRMDHVVCLDQAMVNLLEANYDLQKRSVAMSIIPNWEPLALFPRQGKAAPWPAAAEFAGRFVVLYLGNAGYGHEFATVIEACRHLRNDPVTFLFVGGGKRWTELESFKKQYQLENLILRGYVPKEEVAPLTAAVDCALITLRTNMLGVMSPSKLHSNLAAGLPIVYVGPTTSNVDEAIDRFGCGFSLREGDVDGFVAAIRTLASDATAQASYRNRSRIAFESSYCDTQTLQLFDRVLNSLYQRLDGGAIVAGELTAEPSRVQAA